nr:MAG TPA_asm: hypothetical protein [Caudoviricetes sp.]
MKGARLNGQLRRLTTKPRSGGVFAFWRCRSAPASARPPYPLHRTD